MKTKTEVMSNWTGGVTCGSTNMENKNFGHNRMTIRREEGQCQTKRAEKERIITPQFLSGVYISPKLTSFHSLLCYGNSNAAFPEETTTLISVQFLH
jgi:hypothetical protein